MAETMYWLKLVLEVVTAGCSAFSAVMILGAWLEKRKDWKEPDGKAEVSE